ncbi:hypothetical protein B0H14DRAFT_2610519 [Mycena olivaceomarginata]|nr:hypothetical protein B0H14DRAFT_2610519 [Mycena olivaceomarginata]
MQGASEVLQFPPLNTIAERCVGFPGIVSDFLKTVSDFQKTVSLAAECVGFPDLCAGFPGCVAVSGFVYTPIEAVDKPVDTLDLELSLEGNEIRTAELAVLELGYSESEVTQKTVTLVNGDNFDPSFLKLFVIPFFQFICALIATNKNLRQRHRGLQGMFLANYVQGKQHWRGTLQTLLPASTKISTSLELAANGGEETFGGLLEIFTRKAPADVQAGYFVQLQVHFDAVRSALFEVYPELLPTSGFIGGEVLGEDDFHMIAWVTRIAFIIGTTSSAD